MQADISRPFRHPRKHYRRVLMQQGRVQLDADWNEQVDILLHYLQSLAADLTGPHGTPMRADGRPGTGFDIEEDEDLRWDFLILPGHYYVEGILCEVERVRRYRRQPDFYPADIAKDNELDDDGDYLVYLDVWERHITSIEDPRISEIALGGPDTTTRGHLVWQVKVMSIGAGETEIDRLDETPEDWLRERLLATTGVYALSTAELCARVRPDRPSTDPCQVSPSSRYRGLENQLYRVEIHEGGRARHREDADDNEEEGRGERARRSVRREGGRAEREEPERDRDEWDDDEEREAGDEAEEEEEERERPEPPLRGPTFKWSRENASVIFPIRSISAATVTLDHLGPDDRLGLDAGDWVEIVDDVYDLHRHADPLYKVAAPPDPITMRVTLDPAPSVSRRLRHPFLRRWDQRAEHGVTLRDGAIPVTDDRWIPLEDGIQVRFRPRRSYRTGDYWLIPARTTNGEIEWPRDENGEPACLRPDGMMHHYAPLARIDVDEGEIEVIKDYRRGLLRPWEPITEEEDEGEPEGHGEEHEEEHDEEDEPEADEGESEPESPRPRAESDEGEEDEEEGKSDKQ